VKCSCAENPFLSPIVLQRGDGKNKENRKCKKKETKMREKRNLFADYLRQAGRLGRRQIKKRKEKKEKKKLSIRLKGGEEKMSFVEPCKPRHTMSIFFFFLSLFPRTLPQICCSRKKKKNTSRICLSSARMHLISANQNRCHPRAPRKTRKN
jgi:hypothetical protein